MLYMIWINLQLQNHHRGEFNVNNLATQLLKSSVFYDYIKVGLGPGSW